MILKMSAPKISNIKPNKKITPTICAFSNIFCGTGLPTIISYKVKITCPPSNPGIGIRFKNANQTENIAVKLQNQVQSIERLPSCASFTCILLMIANGPPTFL